MELPPAAHTLEEIYDFIKGRGMRWLTISPKNNAGIAPHKFLFMWLDTLRQLKYISNKFILVVEMSEQLLLHFHAVYDVYDKVKEFKMMNKWRHDAMTRVYNGEPEKGFGYLMKSVENTRQYMPYQDKEFVVITQDTVLDVFRRLKHICDPKKKKLKYSHRLDALPADFFPE